MDKDLQRRIDKANEEYLSEPTEGSVSDDSNEMAYTPTDMYQDARNARYEANKARFPKGSNPKVLFDTQTVVASLAPAHKKAKDDSELLLANGDKQRAGYVKDQYLEEKFLPAIEAIANMHSVDELLNSKKALDMFDEYASLDNKSGTGYTASFLKTLHKEDRGSFSGTSDSMVRDGIKEMMLAANNDKIRSAIDIAKKLKSKIDSGDNIASQEDYELIQKVVLRA